MALAWNQSMPVNPNQSPLSAELAADPSASAVWSKCRPSFSTLQRAFDQLSTISDQLFAAMAQVEGNSRLTPDAKSADMAGIRNKTQETIEALRQTCEAARQQVLTTTQAVLDGDTSTKANPMATLVDIEHTRDAWARTKMILDKSGDSLLIDRVKDVARQAVERGDTYAPAAIRQNICAYLESRNISITPEMLLPQINRAMVPHETPAMRAATLIREALDQRWPRLDAAFLITLGYARGTTVERVHGLLGWDGSLINL